MAALSQVGVGGVEDLAQHLDLLTGFLSLDAIRALGAGTPGIHVEAGATL